MGNFSTILKSGYTQNIKDPILFSKLLSTPIYNKPTTNNWTTINNGTFDRALYIKGPAIIGSDLVDVIMLSKNEYNFDSSVYYLSNGYLEVPIWSNGDENCLVFEEMTVETFSEEYPDIDVSGYSGTIYVYTGENYSRLGWRPDSTVYSELITKRKIPLFANSAAIASLTTVNSGSYYYNSNDNLLYSDDQYTTPITGVDESIYKNTTDPSNIEYYIYIAEDDAFYSIPYDEDYIEHLVELNRILLNGTTIESETEGEPDTVIPGIKDWIYIYTGSKAIDLPSEEALAVHEIKSGTTFEDKFEEYDSKINSMESTINGIPDMVDSALNNVTKTAISVLTYGTVRFGNMSTKSYFNYTASAKNMEVYNINRNYYYVAIPLGFSINHNGILDMTVIFNENIIDLIDDYGYANDASGGAATTSSYYVWVTFKEGIDSTMLYNTTVVIESFNIKYTAER